MLYINGRRADGYHSLQTLFQFIDYCDELSFTAQAKPTIELSSPWTGVTPSQNLVYRAAKLLQSHCRIASGAVITLQKKIPMGAGLGGGSSNAATTLVGLNQLWQTDLSLHELARLGLQLGTDAPVFVHGCASWGEGIGEQLTRVALPEPWYLVLTPKCQVATRQIFSHKELTRNTPTITIATALEHGGKNDCESVVSALYPEVKVALNWLRRFAVARLTGTGASVFASFQTQQEAKQLLKQLPADLTGFVARGLNLSPLHRKAKVQTVL